MSEDAALAELQARYQQRVDRGEIRTDTGTLSPGDATAPRIERRRCKACGERDAPAVVWPTLTRREDGAEETQERVAVGLCSECQAEREPPGPPPESRAERQARLRTVMARVGINADSHGHCRLANFNPDPDAHALADAKRIGAAWRGGDRRNWYLYSTRLGERIAPGAGKTHLVTALWAELWLLGLVTDGGAMFVRETRMAATFRRLIKDGSPEEYLDKLIAVPLLIVDDVGKVQSDSAWLRELFFELYAGREGKPTWATSNYSLAQLEARDEVYMALGSRIASGALITELGGPDRRLSTGE